LAGNEAFIFIGTAAFAAAGQLRSIASGATTTVSGDLDGDRTADFEIALTGTLTLAVGDFVL